MYVKIVTRILWRKNVSESEVVIVKPREVWMQEARAGEKVMAEKGYKTLDEFADKDSHNCGLFLTAMLAMGVPVSKDLQRKVGMVSVKERLGIP
tara:strand:+ start:320 stop:601 length:282 start_codon:yes stop_codon:yes gene_type:complete